VANPLDTIYCIRVSQEHRLVYREFTEKFLGSIRLHNLNNTRTERFDGRYVVGEDTHITRGSRDVHLHDILGVEDGLDSS